MNAKVILAVLLLFAAVPASYAEHFGRAQRWHTLAHVGISLSLEVCCWPNVGPTLTSRRWLMVGNKRVGQRWLYVGWCATNGCHQFLSMPPHHSLG